MNTRFGLRAEQDGRGFGYAIGLRTTDAAPMVVVFAIAALLRTTRARSLLRWRVALPMLLVWAGIAATAPTWAVTGEWLALPLLVILVGRLPLPGLRSAARYGDFSYGLYLWAFPIQQVAVTLGADRLPLLADIAIAPGSRSSWQRRRGGG